MHPLQHMTRSHTYTNRENTGHGRRAGVRPCSAVPRRRTSGRLLLVASALVAVNVAAQSASAGWAILAKYAYGPDEAIAIDVGFLEFIPGSLFGDCTACPDGICDSALGVNLSAYVFIVEHGTVSGTSTQALTDVTEKPHVAIQPFPQPIPPRTTGLGGVPQAPRALPRKPFSDYRPPPIMSPT